MLPSCFSWSHKVEALSTVNVIMSKYNLVQLNDAQVFSSEFHCSPAKFRQPLRVGLARAASQTGLTLNPSAIRHVADQIVNLHHHFRWLLVDVWMDGSARNLTRLLDLLLQILQTGKAFLPSLQQSAGSVIRWPKRVRFFFFVWVVILSPYEGTNHDAISCFQEHFKSMDAPPRAHMRNLHFYLQKKKTRARVFTLFNKIAYLAQEFPLYCREAIKRQNSLPHVFQMITKRRHLRSDNDIRKESKRVVTSS